ncbi:Catalase isozyme C [Coccomyxa sp. Obi]|nr:Catalase isozyme C [Coccomyxa sp. Obi]
MIARMDLQLLLVTLACFAAHASNAAEVEDASSSVLSNNGPFYTSNFGLPVYNNNESLTVGARGPVLLEDYQILEKVATFDREKIPDRVVHARGAVAKGYFEVTDDITALTFADVFSAVGKRTDVIVRFSVVTGPTGSPEWLRDPRGFAIKFYTQQGNWDLVGNNIPVFFIRDGAAFVDLAHALKPSPVNGLSVAWRTADFLSYHPESMHMVTYLLDDVGIPADYRHMNGSSVNTYTLIDKSGNVHYVKFRWVPTVGEMYLLDQDIGKVAMAHPDGSFATEDLFTAIEANNYPEWYMYIQTIDPSASMALDFDPLDPTKARHYPPRHPMECNLSCDTCTWPEDKFPMQRVGKLVLNQNAANFFNENEQLAFSPAHIVPGIGYSDDKLLQWRLVAYDDTQRYRIGPNFGFLPVNAPRCPVHNNRQDGPLNFANQTGAVNYYPSDFANQPLATVYPVDSSTVGPAMRIRTIINNTDDFSQAGARFRSFDSARKARFVQRVSGLLSAPSVTNGITSRWMSYLQQMDSNLASQVSNAVASMKAAAAMGPGVMQQSQAGRRMF